MQLPICKEDVEKGKLCKECQQKLQREKLNETDIELSKILHKLNRKNTISDEVNLVKTEELEENLVLAVIEGDPSTVIGKGGRIIRLISDELGKKVRVIKNGSVIQVTNDLVTPVRACGINTLYRQEGDKEKFITLPAEKKNRIKMSIPKIEESINTVVDDQYSIKFI